MPRKFYDYNDNINVTGQVDNPSDLSALIGQDQLIPRPQMDTIELEKLLSSGMPQNPAPSVNEQDIVKQYLLDKFSNTGNDLEGALNKASRLISTTAPGIMTKSAPIFTEPEPVTKSGSDFGQALGLANYLQRAEHRAKGFEEQEKNRDLREKLSDRVDTAKQKAFEFRQNEAAKKDVAGLQKELEQSPDFKEGMKQLGAANNAKQLLNEISSGNELAIGALKTAVIRMSGEVGTLSDKDREALGGNQSIVSKLSRISERATSGGLTDEDFQDYTNITNAFEKSARSKIESAYSRKATQGSIRLNKSEGEIQNVLRAGQQSYSPSQSPQLPEMSEMSRKANAVIGDPTASPERKAKARQVLERIKLEMSKSRK